MKKLMSAMSILRIIGALAILSASLSVNASDVRGGNSGFMKPVPEGLRQQFPMCDEFLNVTWIDSKKQVGYTEYEAIVKNRKNPSIRSKKKVWALVTLPDDSRKGLPPRYDYDAYQFVSQGKKQALFEMVRNGRVEVGFALTITDGADTVSLYGGKAVDDERHPVLADHQKSVCIAYPDAQKVWVIEGKNVFHAYPSNEVREIYERLKVNGFRMTMENFQKMWVLDINRDGADDYLTYRKLIFSNDGELVQSNEKYEDPIFIYTTSINGNQCRIHNSRLVFDLTSDGERFFVTNCDLTQMGRKY